MSANRYIRLATSHPSAIRQLFYGLVWGHMSALAVLAMTLRWGRELEAAAGHPAMRAVSWTLLLPSTVTALLTTTSSDPFAAAASGAIPAAAIWMMPLLTGIACTLAWRVASGIPAHRVLVRVTCAAMLLGTLGATSLYTEIDSHMRAEALFIEMCTTNSLPHLNEASVAVAKRLTTDHPRARWASEGWRVQAMRAEHDGNPIQAAALWQRYGSAFGDEPLPGRALAHYNIGRNLELAGKRDEAARHYADTLRTMQAGGHDVQPWLFAQAARSLARMSDSDGLPATAQYWNTRANAYERLQDDPLERS